MTTYKFYINTGLGLGIKYIKEENLNKAFAILNDRGMTFKYKKI